MTADWVDNELSKTDRNRDLIILEKPDVRRYLDNLLHRLWHDICHCIVMSDFDYFPGGNPQIAGEYGQSMRRFLAFWLMDRQRVFFRGKLSSSVEAWTMESEFSLYLTSRNDPHIVFEILGNSRFRANPPHLRINKQSHLFFRITFRGSVGMPWQGCEEPAVCRKVRSIISTNIEMQRIAREGQLSGTALTEFLTKAFEVYEAM